MTVKTFKPGLRQEESIRLDQTDQVILVHYVDILVMNYLLDLIDTGGVHGGCIPAINFGVANHHVVGRTAGQELHQLPDGIIAQTK